MRDFPSVSAASGQELYDELISAAEGLTDGEQDAIANMANIAALLWHSLAGLNWAGFYRAVGDELVLGPFQGKPACIRIPFGQGVCGTAAVSQRAELVADVHAFPGHIACDPACMSELVVPVLRAGETIAVIDLDSPLPAHFGEDDVAGLERLAKLLSDRI